jgi:hypothetical protein
MSEKKKKSSMASEGSKFSRKSMEADGLAKLFGMDQTSSQQVPVKKTSFEFLGSSDIDTINWTAVLDSLQVI